MRRRTDRSAVAVLVEYLRFHECAAESADRESMTRVELATGGRSGDRAILGRNLIGTHCGEGFFSLPPALPPSSEPIVLRQWTPLSNRPSKSAHSTWAFSLCARRKSDDGRRAISPSFSCTPPRRVSGKQAFLGGDEKQTKVAVVSSSFHPR